MKSTSSSSIVSGSGTPASRTPTAPVHLVVLCHGLWGEPRHLLALETLLSLSLGDKARVVGAAVDAESSNAKPTNAENRRSKRADTTKPSRSKRISHESSPSTRTSTESSAGADKLIASSKDDVSSGPRSEQKEASHPNLSDAEKDLLRPFVIPRDEDVDMDIVILNVTCNAGGKTYDGIDWQGERTVEEIRAEEKRLAKERHQHVARFSMVGYSVGGLVARYVIGALEADGFFAESSAGRLSKGKRGTVSARQLVTIATPHVGCPPTRGAFSRIAAFVGGRLLSRTGEQLFILDGNKLDKGATGKNKQSIGLLEQMAKPDSVFLTGLRRFERVRFYANAVNDPTVPFRTGCIEELDPFAEGLHVNVELIDDTPLIKSFASQDPLPLTLKQSLYAAVPSAPPFFNPRRLPFRFPYNYMVVGFSPVLLPLMVSLAIYRLSKDNKRSRLRVKDLEQGVDSDIGGSDRLSKLLSTVIQSAGEERVDGDALEPEGITDETRSLSSSSSVNATRSSDVSGLGTQKENLSEPKHKPCLSPKKRTTARRSPWSSEQIKSTKLDQLPEEKRRQPVLFQAQRAMVHHLNDPKVLPRMSKIWVYFPDVVNAHAIIVCRVPSMEVQRRGLPVLRHLLSDFLL